MGVFFPKRSLVTGAPFPVAISYTQMSRVPFSTSFLMTTNRLPSGENAGWLYRPGSPTLLTTFPSRSNMVICWKLRALGRRQRKETLAVAADVRNA